MAETFTVPIGLDLAAVAFGAVQGAVFASRVAREKQIDVIGVCAIGIGTGVGGGIIRDLLLNEQPVALLKNAYLLTAVAAALVGMLFGHLLNKVQPLVVATDAASLGLYLVVGTGKAIGLGIAPVPAMFVGVLACTGGTVLRDVLLRTDIGLIHIGSFYVVAAIGGAISYVTLEEFTSDVTASIAAIGVTIGLRMLSLWFGWSSPSPRELLVTGQQSQ